MPVYKNEEIDFITDFNKGLQYNYSKIYDLGP